ncbi:MAG: rod shape-determining protein MreD [Anaerolineae bacterium]
MTIYLVLPLLAIVAILQTTLVPSLAIWSVFANLPLLVVVSWGLLRGPQEGALWGFIAGLMVDLLSGAPFGAATVSLIVIGFLAGLGETTVFRARIALPMIVMFLATIVYELLFLLIVRISGQSVAWLDSVLRLVIPSAILNAVLTPVVFLTMSWLYARFGREEMEW